MSAFSGVSKILEVAEAASQALPKVARATEQAGETGVRLSQAASEMPAAGLKTITGAGLPRADAKIGANAGDAYVTMPSILSFFGDDGKGAEALSALSTVKHTSAPSKVSTVLDFGESVPLGEALTRILPVADKVNGPVKFNPHFVRGFLSELGTHSISDELRVRNVLGTGGEYTLTLGTENNLALKLSPQQQMSRPVPNPEFDAPVLGHGNVGDRLHFYAQPIGNVTDVTPAHVRDVLKRIRAEGYSAEDIDVNDPRRLVQTALFDGDNRALLIDQGCATPLYGMQYEGSGLVPHARQQVNLQGVRDIIRDQGLMGQTLGEVRDPVLQELKRRRYVPTLSVKWTSFEVTEALKALVKPEP